MGGLSPTMEGELQFSSWYFLKWFCSPDGDFEIKHFKFWNNGRTVAYYLLFVLVFVPIYFWFWGRERREEKERERLRVRKLLLLFLILILSHEKIQFIDFFWKICPLLTLFKTHRTRVPYQRILGLIWP